MACAIGALLWCAPAVSGSFRINPVQIVIPSDRRAASLTITNSDAAPVSVQVLTYRWSQSDGLDVYSPTGDVISSPPMFTMAPGSSQLVRIGLKKGADASAYRVIFSEIRRDKPAEGQIHVNLRLNLPLYVLPAGGGSSRLSWRAWVDHAGVMFAEGRNSGNLHAQIVGLSADISGRRTSLSQKMGVVLPGSARLWNLGKQPGFAAGQPLVLIVRSSSGETQTRAVVEQR